MGTHGGASSYCPNSVRQFFVIACLFYTEDNSCRNLSEIFRDSDKFQSLKTSMFYFRQTDQIHWHFPASSILSGPFTTLFFEKEAQKKHQKCRKWVCKSGRFCSCCCSSSRRWFSFCTRICQLASIIHCCKGRKAVRVDGAVQVPSCSYSRVE